MSCHAVRIVRSAAHCNLFALQGPISALAMAVLPAHCRIIHTLLSPVRHACRVCCQVIPGLLRRTCVRAPQSLKDPKNLQRVCSLFPCFVSMSNVACNHSPMSPRTSVHASGDTHPDWSPIGVPAFSGQPMSVRGLIAHHSSLDFARPTFVALPSTSYGAAHRAYTLPL